MSSATPKVTVLMTVYGGADLVGGAVESVLAQTFRDFELLVVDDCSPDRSLDVLRAYDDPRIRVMQNQRNLGQVASLNRGLGNARGEIVVRLDQDDHCLPVRLERQVEVLEREPSVGVVGAWLDGVDERGRPVPVAPPPPIGDRVDFAFLILTGRLALWHPAVAFRRRPALELGGYEETYRLAEDQDLWRRFALAGWDARVVEEPLVRFRFHAGQQSQRHADAQQQAKHAGLERFVEELGGDVDARALRLLLGWDADFWRAAPSGAAVAADLARLLDGAQQRLHLDEREAARLRALVGERVALDVRRAWRHGVGSFWRTAPALRRFARATQPQAPHDAAQFAALYVGAPLLRAAWRLRPFRDGVRRLVHGRPAA